MKPASGPATLQGAHENVVSTGLSRLGGIYSVTVLPVFLSADVWFSALLRLADCTASKTRANTQSVRNVKDKTVTQLSLTSAMRTDTYTPNLRAWVRNSSNIIGSVEKRVIIVVIIIIDMSVNSNIAFYKLELSVFSCVENVGY